MVQLGVLPAQALHHVDGQHTDLRGLHDHGVMLIFTSQQGLHSCNIRGSKQAHDALGAVRQILHQFHQPASNGEQAVGLVTGVVENIARLQGKLLDGLVDVLEVFFFQACEQHCVPDGADLAVGFTFPGFFLCD